MKKIIRKCPKHDRILWKDSHGNLQVEAIYRGRVVGPGGPRPLSKLNEPDKKYWKEYWENN